MDTSRLHRRRLHQRRIRRRRQPGNTARPALPPPAQPTEPSGKATEIANSVFGAGSLILALMLYTGFVHGRAYYAYFHLDVFSVGFDPVEMALRSSAMAQAARFDTAAMSST
ncbi:hypothetical protein ACFWY6_17505 [Streptomyces sp. NPDC059037]|uniref:hypothetical protein n=1 Tax=Streptomyces sp. NPDC059037 TaxID=3346710 RepID=UPI0036BD7446